MIDGSMNTSTPITTGYIPQAIAVNPVTNKIYAAMEDGRVDVIDGSTSATELVAVGSGPFGAAVNPITDKIYVANYGSDNVTVIDGATNMTRRCAIIS